ncbi:uncharacterized protein [Nicotiana tomentosiformis]|uniref:uncharacterized protein n=1 Tax=Nicotiana tomentosiformis TaxID=4098 RepID=UPI00388C91E6
MHRVSWILSSGISFTTFQFSRAALSYWEDYKRHRPVDAAPFTWQQFSIIFLEKFVPQSCREELRRQFEQLQSACHAIRLVPTYMEKIKRFIDGLTYQLQLLMTRERVYGATFDEVVDISRQIKMVRSQERVKREEKRPRGQGRFSGVPSRD